MAARLVGDRYFLDLFRFPNSNLPLLPKAGLFVISQILSNHKCSFLVVPGQCDLERGGAVFVLRNEQTVRIEA